MLESRAKETGMLEKAFKLKSLLNTLKSGQICSKLLDDSLIEVPSAKRPEIKQSPSDAYHRSTA